MKQMPVLTTERLILRLFTLKDCKTVQTLAGEKDIAKTTLTIPHPYKDGMAKQWITSHKKKFVKGELVCLAITEKDDKNVIGAISLTVNTKHNRAELGYWVGKKYWRKGYCTEAAHAIIHYGFHSLKLNRIYATHFILNKASGRVMQKVGMIREGLLKQHVLKWGTYIDLVQYGILQDDYNKARGDR